MNYLPTLTKLVKTSFEKSWQLLIILQQLKTKHTEDTSQDCFNAEIWKK